MKSRDYKLILASQSPRRKQLLFDANYEFEVRAPDDSVEEGICSKCSPEDLVMRASIAKAKAIADEIEDGLVLAADTIAVCKEQILGKPVDRDHAEGMLRLMSGQRHRVITGVCLRHRPSNRMSFHLEQTTLKMDDLSEEQLKLILDSDGWIGKAGAFGYQDGLDWVHVEIGLESNVVGLPVERLEDWIVELMSPDQ